MGKFRHGLRRLQSTIFGEEGKAESPSPGPSKVPTDVDEPQDLYLEPLLDLSTMIVTRTWKDLPQEIVDYIMSMFRNDSESLKACSLTCKAMFISTRRLIHRKIRLTSEQNWAILTLKERQRYIRGDRQEFAVKVLSWIAAQGLLPYGRQLFIDLHGNFTPANLQPFNDLFQQFDQIQELSIQWFHTRDFLEQFDTFFAKFVPTLRSLRLDAPSGDARDILDFVCRFPHLDDLTFEASFDNSYDQIAEALPAVKKIAPFRGRLKFNDVKERHSPIVRQFISLPGKRRFRFVDFRDCHFQTVEQPIIDACSGTIETLSITWKKIREKGLPINLSDVKNLRSLTLWVDFRDIESSYEGLLQTIRTIASPFFSEFVIEVVYVFGTLEPAKLAWKWWGTWTELDERFERMDVERGFRVVIRAEKVDKDLNFIAQARNRLPLMDARGRLVFEIGPFPEK